MNAASSERDSDLTSAGGVDLAQPTLGYAARNHLVDYLADRDAPCPLCGYNLRNLQTDRCPECGRRLQLTVGLTEPAIGAWVAVLVATLLPAAFGLVLIVVFFVSMSYARSGMLLHDFKTSPVPVQFMIFHAIAAVPASIVLLACRRLFLKLKRPTQLLYVIAAFCADITTILCVIYMSYH